MIDLERPGGKTYFVLQIRQRIADLLFAEPVGRLAVVVTQLPHGADVGFDGAGAGAR